MRMSKRDNNILLESKNFDENNLSVDDSLILRWCKMQCELCYETFQRFIDIKMHYQNEHQEKGFVMCCKKKFFSRIGLMDHAAKHMNSDTIRYYQFQ